MTIRHRISNIANRISNNFDTRYSIFDARFLWLSAAMFSGCITPQIAVNSRADFSRIHRVAVASFGGPGGDVAADLLTQDLLQHGADVVERQRLDAVLREQNLAQENILDPTTVKKIGKILGVASRP
jgi:hypothetical protein